MREVSARLSALVPEAASVLKVIGYFDQLVEHRAGLRAAVRGAAVLAGCPVRMHDRARESWLRVLPDGKAAAMVDDPVSRWPHRASADGQYGVWLERDGEPSVLDDLIIERLLLAAGTFRSRPPTAQRDASAWMRVLVDPDAPEPMVTEALRGCGLTPSTPVCAVAMVGATPQAKATPVIARSTSEGVAVVLEQRAGIGPMVAAKDAAQSWQQAQLAALLTASGTPTDPGERVVFADHAGGFLAIAQKWHSGDHVPADVAAIDAAAMTAPWLLQTLDAVSTAESLRDAAASLHLHHSTVQERIARAERMIGWEVLSQRGKQRTQLALVMRRIIGNLG